MYGRENELAELTRLIDAGRWTILLGPRMVGKTSLAKAALAQTRRPTIYVNLWGVRSAAGLLDALRVGLSANRTLVRRLRDGLSRIQGVTLAGTGVVLAPQPWPLRTFHEMLNLVGRMGENAVIVLDEVQELAAASGPLHRLFANLFNTYPKITLVLTGSYFGLVRSLLETNSNSPLYGRPPARIELEPFDRQVSVGFLETGFHKYGVRVDRKRLSEVIDRSLDGIPGWLTLFGNAVTELRMPVELAEKYVVTEAKKVVRTELEHFLEHRDVTVYWAALRALTRPAAWGDVREAVSEARGSTPNENSLRKILRGLRDAGIVRESDHKYGIRDPMVRAFVEGTARMRTRSRE